MKRISLVVECEICGAPIKLGPGHLIFSCNHREILLERRKREREREKSLKKQRPWWRFW